MEAYASIPYLSLPYPELHPAHLAVLGRLHGLNCRSPRAARVLEIGCAAGGHLIPIAFYLPETHCLGLEPDPLQAESGNRLLRRAGIDNCEIRPQAATREALQNEAPFDYIICHGVYSWVEPAVREEIVATIAQLLAPEGIACISYNTLPGWRLRGTLRDIFGWHLQGVAEPRQRVADARELIEWLLTQQEGLDALSAQMLVAECQSLRQAPDSYLYHEYLCATNEPLLYGEFCAHIAAHGLHAVCDSDLSRRHAPPLPDTALAAIDAIPDLHEQEQYLDFLLNRNFRQTLVARTPGAPAEWPLLRQLAWCGALQPPKKPHLDRAKATPFTRSDGSKVTVHHPLTKAAMIELATTYPAAWRFDDLSQRAQTRLRSAGVAAGPDDTEHLFAECVSLWVHGALQVLPEADDPRVHHPERLNALAAAMLELGWEQLTGPRHQALTVSDAIRNLTSDHASPAWSLCQQLGLCAEA